MEENNIQINNKKTFLSILGVAILVVGLVGITYAFFNYTRTGSANTIKVGRIAFNSNQTETINLINAFPISNTDALSDTANSDEAIISVTGDTTYDNGVEYLITVTGVSNTVNNKVVPINILVRTSNGLGTSDEDYFTNRGGNTSLYKILSDGTIENDKRILVGYIAKGSTGINGSVTIKAYLDSSNVAISDTYDVDNSGTDNNGTMTDWVDARTVLTTSEWNSIQTNGVSFKVKVEANEGTWVNEVQELYNTIISPESNPNQSGSNEPGQSGQSSSHIPLDNENSTYVQNVSTDSITKAKVRFLDADNSEHRVIKLSYGINFVERSSDTNGKGLYIRAGTENDEYPIYYYRGEVYNNNVIFAGYCWLIVRTTDTGGIKLVYNGELDENGTCMPPDDDPVVEVSGEVYDTSDEGSGESYSGSSNEENDSGIRRRGSIATIGTTYYSNFPDNDVSMAYYGYMYGTPYTGVNENNIAASTIYFSSSFEYDDFDNDGVEEYKLAGNIATGLGTGRHYTCNLTTQDGTCDKIRYVYSAQTRGNTGKHDYTYILLSNGENVSDAIAKMKTTGNKSTDTSSKAKIMIDDWYKKNMIKYTNQLEDTVWCNDRSSTKLGAWSEDGALYNSYMIYSAATRIGSGTPNLGCTDLVDSYTVSSENGNGMLDYPVGMLTVDELELSGTGAYMDQYTIHKPYLVSEYYYWTMSPHYFWAQASSTYYVTPWGIFYEDFNVYSKKYIRPAISLKAETKILSNGADGTAGNPYIVE